MQKIIVLHKKEGETPLEALEFYRTKNKEYAGVPMTYAGRLDPMASGVLMVLAGEETRKKEKYLKLDKEYEFEVLFGFATDTYDILGKISHLPIRTNSSMKEDRKLNLRGKTSQVTHFNILTNIGMKEMQKKVNESLKYFKGEIVQKYPVYSSKTVNGKPLFAYAREGEEVEAPSRKVVVKKLSLEKWRRMSGKVLLSNIEKRVKRINGDFRQKDILKIWKKELKGREKENFMIMKFKIMCASGTYVRTIADSLGNKIGVPALAYSIKRTKVGRFI